MHTAVLRISTDRTMFIVRSVGANAESHSVLVTDPAWRAGLSCLGLPHHRWWLHQEHWSWFCSPPGRCSRRGCTERSRPRLLQRIQPIASCFLLWTMRKARRKMNPLARSLFSERAENRTTAFFSDAWFGSHECRICLLRARTSTAVFRTHGSGPTCTGSSLSPLFSWRTVWECSLCRRPGCWS